MQPLKTTASPSVVVDHRLRAALGEVDDRQPPVGEPDAVRRSTRRAPSGPRGASDVAHPRERLAVRPRRRGAARRRSRTSLARGFTGTRNSSTSAPHEAAQVVVARVARATTRWRAAPESRGERAHARRARPRSPASAACGAHASSSSSSSSGAGRSRSRSGSTKSAPIPSRSGEEAVLLEHLGARRRRPAARARPSCASSRTRHCTSATSARGVLQARLRVHDRAPRACRARLQARVPPQERRLGDRAAAQQHVDRLDVLRVAAEAARDARAREGAGTPACAPTPGPCRGPARTASWPTAPAAAAGARACRRSARTAIVGVGHRDVHVQREGRLAPRQLAHRVEDRAGSARRARPRSPPTARTGACPRRPRACRCG